MSSPAGCGVFARYLFRQRDGQVTELRTENNKALLPHYAFRDHLLPTPQAGVILVDGFSSAGHYLGHMALFERVVDREAKENWDAPTVLRLRPDLMIGPVWPPTRRRFHWWS